MRCPRCGSENISSIINTNTHTKGFDGSDACCGYLLFGWPGFYVDYVTPEIRKQQQEQQIYVMIVGIDFNEEKYTKKNMGMVYAFGK